MLSYKIMVIVVTSMAALFIILPQADAAVADIFTYKNSSGKSKTISNITPDGKCHLFDFSAGHLDNKSKAVAIAYFGKDCKGNDVTLHPGQDIHLPDVFNSIKFNK
jgi:hypothetical protein